MTIQHLSRILGLSAAAGALTLGPAMAGGINDPVADVAAPPPPVPAPVIAQGGDWTGAYGGIQLGYGDISGDVDGDDFLYGVHAGYDYDFGTFVLGGEIDYDFADIDLGGGAEIDSVARLKLRAGYDFGQILGYVTAGVAEADTSIGSESGEFYGIGVTYRVTDRYTVGAELLEHNFDDISGTGVDADATTLSVRGSIRF